MPALEPHSLLISAGLLYLAMPVAVWGLLYRRHARPNLELWCLSGLLSSAALVLLGLRGTIHDVFTIVLADGLGFVSPLLKAGVLRMENGQAPRWPRLAAFGLAALVIQFIGLLLLSPGARAAGAYLIYTAYSAMLAWTAYQLHAAWRSRSAALMGWLFAAFGAFCALRALRMIVGWSDGQPLSPQWDFVTLVALAFLSCAAADIAFLGMTFDRVRASTSAQRGALDALRDQQIARDLATRTREAVAGERARTTRLLAHEVRQPLHNAAVALQSAVSVLSSSRNAGDAGRAIEQAQAVIRRVSATLDNTVAATALLSGAGRLSTADTDLQMLIELSLGDLAPGARPRVQVEYQADARSARLEPTLVRLALRNLLANAMLYAPPDSPVRLRVLDSDDPLALMIEVADQGPGIPDEMRERIFEEGVRGQQPTVPGYGLGLHVVKRVAQLHGGRIEWRPNQPQGSVFRLTLPQGDPG
ncbi:MAG: sensor histidine kinase [Proteobacteria bacterium]|nr:sensor histidine kinase [Pseudomonadota bacterium]